MIGVGAPLAKVLMCQVLTHFAAERRAMPTSRLWAILSKSELASNETQSVAQMLCLKGASCIARLEKRSGLLKAWDRVEPNEAWQPRNPKLASTRFAGGKTFTRSDLSIL